MKTTHTCDRCSGTGNYAQFGVCYKCKGTGTVQVKEYTLEERAKLDARNESLETKRMEARKSIMATNIEKYPFLEGLDDDDFKPSLAKVMVIEMQNRLLSEKQAAVVERYLASSE